MPYARQSISKNDIDEVVKILKSDWLTQGPTIEKFETGVARFSRSKYAVAVCNATSALHIACRVCDLGPGDIAWTSSNSFVASANCARYCGASVDFVDIDPQTYNISPTALENKLENAKKLPKIVIPVHFGGQSCEMEKIFSLSRKFKFKIIEDASHAIGGRYQEKPVGNCEFSDMTVFSFHPVKIITTGEGGMIVTNDPSLAKRLRLFRSHGITKNPEDFVGQPAGKWYYEQQELGFNYRITDFQAALGLSQLGRINGFIKKRHSIAKRYNIGLRDLPLVLPRQHTDSFSSYHLYVVRVDSTRTKKSRNSIFDFLKKHKINPNVHYIPIHTQPDFQKLGFNWGDFPETERYYQEAISLPMFYGLTKKDQEYVISKIKENFA